MVVINFQTSSCYLWKQTCRDFVQAVDNNEAFPQRMYGEIPREKRGTRKLTRSKYVVLILGTGFGKHLVQQQRNCQQR